MNLTTGDRARMHAGTRLRLTGGRRQLIELYEDGTLVAAARFDTLLGANIDGDRQIGLLKVHSLALVEYTHDFVLAYDKILDYLEPRPHRLRLELGIRHAAQEGANLYLPPHALGTHGYDHPWERNPVKENDFTWHVDVDGDRLDVPRVALRLVERAYAFFDLTSESIPYLTDDRSAIDPTRFGRPPA